MSQRNYPVGTNQVPLFVTVNDSGPVTGLTVTARIIVPWTGQGFDFFDNTFKAVGVIVTPTVTLSAATTAGVYFALWNSSGVLVDTDVIVIYEGSGIATFIADEGVSFQTAGSGTTSIVNSFIEAAFDATNRTLTIVGGVKNAESGLIVSSAATFTVKDELGQTLFAGSTTSLNGLHRKVFPNVTLPPNRILLVFASFVVGAATYDAVETLAVLGAPPVGAGA